MHKLSTADTPFLHRPSLSSRHSSSTMAERFSGDGAASNGFGRRHLREDEARLLYEAEYPVPPDMRVPGDMREGADENVLRLEFRLRQLEANE